MRLRPDIRRERVQKAQREFEHAEDRFDSTLKYEREGSARNYAVKFVDSQRCIERSCKAIFKLMDVQYEREHAISPRSNEGTNLLNKISEIVSDLAENEPHTLPEYDPSDPPRIGITPERLEQITVNATARIMFLSEMYGNMYSLASYGIDMNNVELAPNDFIQYQEHEYAIESALSSLRIADVLIDLIATGELPRSSRPSGQEGPIESLSAIRDRHYGVGKQFNEHDPIAEYRRNL